MSSQTLTQGIEAASTIIGAKLHTRHIAHLAIEVLDTRVLNVRRVMRSHIIAMFKMIKFYPFRLNDIHNGNG